jgi:hypothetical protein
MQARLPRWGAADADRWFVICSNFLFDLATLIGAHDRIAGTELRTRRRLTG